MTLVPFLFPPFLGSPALTEGFDHRGELAVSDGRQLDRAGRFVAGRSGHHGNDWGLRMGTPVLAAADGVVVEAGDVGPVRCGKRVVERALRVVVEHEVVGQRFRTSSLHLSRVDVATGDRVERGRRLGLSGRSGCASGPHLHFAVEIDDGGWRPIDPFGWTASFADPSRSAWLWVVAPKEEGGARSSLPRDGG